MISNTVGVGSNSIFFFFWGGGGGGGGGECNIHCDAAICAACMNINKVSRVKHRGGGGPGPPVPTPTGDSFLFPLNYTAQSSNVIQCVFMCKKNTQSGTQM